MKYLYNLIIYCYYFGIKVSSIFNNKAKLWVKGRNIYFEKLSLALKRNGFTKEDTKKAWFHCASLGEFEQGRPIIEAFRKKFPNYKILLTFFSPSGYEVRNAYIGADLVEYLPIDTLKNAKKFVEIVKPDIAFFVKYEFWYNLLSQLQKNNIPTFLISGIFRPDQLFFRWYGGWFRNILSRFTHLFVQNNASKELLEFIGIKQATVSGDTRFDRVFAISQEKINFSVISDFCNNENVIIAGSTWEKDEELLGYFLEKTQIPTKIIIAPHEVNEERILKLLNRFPYKTVRYSQTNGIEAKDARILIIDTIGILSQIYKYGYIAYVGGGFNSGIHNILEPAAFGLPIIIGPKISKFQEAFDLTQRQGAVVVHSDVMFKEKVEEFLTNPQRSLEAKQTCLNYVEARVGTTQKVIDWLIDNNIVK